MVTFLFILSGCGGDPCGAGMPGAKKAAQKPSEKLIGTWAPDVDATINSVLVGAPERRIAVARKALKSVRFVLTQTTMAMKIFLPENDKKKMRPGMVMAMSEGMKMPYKIMKETTDTISIEVEKKGSFKAVEKFSITFMSPNKVKVTHENSNQRIKTMIMNKVK